MKHNILKLGYLLLTLFVILVVYLSYLQVIKGPALAANPYNRRLMEHELQVRRGTVYDTKGVALAKTEFSGDKGRRVYPKGPAMVHLLGYVSTRYGRTGLESAYDNYLLGMEGPDRIKNTVNKFLGKEQAGGDVILTLDSSLQQLAMDLLDGRRGSVILLDPRTGAVRVMASSPSYDPNRLEELWPQLSQDKALPLINRAAQGAYPPGSTFKLVTAAGALAADPGLDDSSFNCPGYIVVDGFKLTDLAAHGEVNVKRALAVSCNTTFAQLGLQLGADGFYRTVKAFGVDQDPAAGVPVRPGTLTAPDKMKPTALASSAIGQGELLVSPLHMTLVAAAIANKGVSMQPYVVEAVKDSRGNTVQRYQLRTWLNPTTPVIAEVIKEGMVEAVQAGTAKRAAVSGMQVAGKTGQAENPHGIPHAWFVGFAPADQPRFAVAVIVENGGSGGAVAAPIASKLITAAAAKGY